MKTLNNPNTSPHLFIPLSQVMAMRAARRHKLFALICFLFFIVARLWVLAILEMDYGLMMFCFVCTIFTIHIWRKESRRGDAQIAETLRELVASLEGLEGNLTSETNSGVETEEKSNWRRFKWKNDEGKSEFKPHDIDIEIGNASALSLPPPAPLTPNFERKCPHGNSPLIEPDVLQGQSMCSICLCDYDEDDEVVVLPCQHLFHDDCLNQWIANHYKCPLCNHDLRNQEQVRRADERAREEEARNASQRQMHQSGILVFTL